MPNATETMATTVDEQTQAQSQTATESSVNETTNDTPAPSSASEANHEHNESTNVQCDPVPSLLETSSDEEAQPTLGAPEQYQEFKLPEGLPFGADKLNSFVGVARELNLNQEQAQKVVDAMGDIHKQYIENVTSTYRKTWAEQVQNDPEIGGERFKENLSYAKRAYTQFTSPALRKDLEKSGLNNHPEIVRMFAKIGRSMSQDKGVRGEASAPRGPIRRFPNSNMVVED